MSVRPAPFPAAEAEAAELKQAAAQIMLAAPAPEGKSGCFIRGNYAQMAPAFSREPEIRVTVE
jgi:hypothetical protein